MPLFLLPIMSFLTSRAGMILLVGTIAFASGYRTADRSAELRHAQAQLEIVKEQSKAAERINQEQSLIAKAEYQALERDQAKLKALLDEQRKSPVRDRRCLDRGDARRLRSL